MLITRLYEFEAAHHLPDHDGKCRNPHGHSYKLEVSVGSDQLILIGPKRGMVMDFADLDSYLRPLIGRLDHQNLNDIAELDPPTAENIANYIWKEAQEVISGVRNVWLARVKLYETSKSYVEVSR